MTTVPCTDSAGHVASHPTTPTVRPRSENTFQSAATRRSEEVTGACPPAGRSTMKSRMRWSSGLRPVAIVVQTIGERIGGVASKMPVRPRALEPREGRQPTHARRADRCSASRRRRSRPARSAVAARGLPWLRRPPSRLRQPGRREPRRGAGGAAPAQGISPSHSHRVTPGFPALRRRAASPTTDGAGPLRPRCPPRGPRSAPHRHRSRCRPPRARGAPDEERDASRLERLERAGMQHLGPRARERRRLAVAEPGQGAGRSRRAAGRRSSRPARPTRSRRAPRRAPSPGRRPCSPSRRGREASSRRARCRR